MLEQILTVILGGFIGLTVALTFFKAFVEITANTISRKDFLVYGLAMTVSASVRLLPTGWDLRDFISAASIFGFGFVWLVAWGGEVERLFQRWVHDARQRKLKQQGHQQVREVKQANG
jgi:hypothetical protein